MTRIKENPCLDFHYWHKWTRLSPRLMPCKLNWDQQSFSRLFSLRIQFCAVTLNRDSGYLQVLSHQDKGRLNFLPSSCLIVQWLKWAMYSNSHCCALLCILGYIAFRSQMLHAVWHHPGTSYTVCLLVCCLVPRWPLAGGHPIQVLSTLVENHWAPAFPYCHIQDSIFHMALFLKKYCCQLMRLHFRSRQYFCLGFLGGHVSAARSKIENMHISSSLCTSCILCLVLLVGLSQ